MKSKTKVLFVTLSAIVIALCVLTVNLYKSQRELKQTISNAEKTANLIDEKNIPAVKASFVSYNDEDNFVDAAEKTVNTVVHIKTEVVSKGNSYYDFFGSLIEQLYGGGHMQMPNSVSVAYGSGVVISPDGYIVTNNHVVENATKEQCAEIAKVRWFIDVGDDDFLFDNNMDFIKAMRSKRIPYQLRVREGGHTWQYWQQALYIALPFVSENFGK